LSGLNDKARYYALKLLSYRGRSEKELEGKLREKGFPETVTSSTLHHLKQVGLINDRTLAEALKRQATTAKMLGQKGVRRFMVNRGIPRDIIDSMFISDEKEDIENAKRLVEKKLRIVRDYPAEKIRRRLYNLLQRKGYSYDTIKMVLKNKNLNLTTESTEDTENDKDRNLD